MDSQKAGLTLIVASIISLITFGIILIGISLVAGLLYGSFLGIPSLIIGLIIFFRGEQLNLRFMGALAPLLSLMIAFLILSSTIVENIFLVGFVFVSAIPIIIAGACISITGAESLEKWHKIVLVILCIVAISALFPGVYALEVEKQATNSAEETLLDAFNLAESGNIQSAIDACARIQNIPDEPIYNILNVGRTRANHISSLYTDICYQDIIPYLKDSESINICSSMVDLTKSKCIIELAKKSKTVAYCNELGDIKIKSMCIAEVAKETNNKELCALISATETICALPAQIGCEFRIDKQQALLTNDLTICSESKYSDLDKDACLISLINGAEDKNICASVTPANKNNCLMQLAQATGDSSYCEEIKTITVGNAVLADKQICLDSAKFGLALKTKDARICKTISDLTDLQSECLVSVSAMPRNTLLSYIEISC